MAATESDLEQERAAREAAERRAEQAERVAAVHDAIAARGFLGEKAAALRRLVDPAAEDLGAAVDAAVKQYAGLFASETPAPPAKVVRRRGPSTPPAVGESRMTLPGGFIDPETYMLMPRSERLTERVRRRVEVSRPYWPKFLDPKDLPRGE